MENLKIKASMRMLSPVILRIGLGFVVMWFGIQQISDPSAWIAYLPRWTASLPISQTTFVSLNGWFELVFSALLIVGLYTRIVALFLALHLFSIVFTVGYNEIGVRDFGLAVALASVFLHGASGWSVDEFKSSSSRLL